MCVLEAGRAGLGSLSHSVLFSFLLLILPWSFLKSVSFTVLAQ